jgi:hypothetical protein
MNELDKLNKLLKELVYSSKELLTNVEKSGELLKTDLAYKIRSGLETF